MESDHDCMESENEMLLPQHFSRLAIFVEIISTTLQKIRPQIMRVE